MIAGDLDVRWEVDWRRFDPSARSEEISLRILEDRRKVRAADGRIRALYDAPTARGAEMPAVVWVGGVGGGTVGPANRMYERLARTLAGDGAASIRVDYRHPRQLEPCIVDCAVGAQFVRAQGAGRLALVGHSAGGAVAVTVGALLPDVATVVALATQSFGTERAADLAPASLLLVHGTDDVVLPPSASASVARRAATRTDLRLIEGAGHWFERHEAEVNALVLDWLRRELGLAAAL